MKIEIPSKCPSCGSSLELINAQLFCRNRVLCPAQNSKIIENFCSKLKLKGFGPQTIAKLELTRVSQLFHLPTETLVSVLGEKTGTKLAAELNEKLRGEVDFASLLSSLGIPLLGDVAAKKLALQFNSFEDLKADGAVGESIRAWRTSPTGIDVQSLPWKFAKASENSVNGVVNDLGISVCITGSLKDFKNRTDASEYLTSLGLTVKKSVTKDVKYLICEDESKRSSSSYLKAVNNGVTVVTITELTNLIKENN